MNTPNRLFVIGLSWVCGLALTACTGVVPITPNSLAPPQPAARVSQFTPVTATLTAPPVPVRGSDGRVHIAYELLLANLLSQPASVASLKVVAQDRTLLSFDRDALKPSMLVLGGKPGNTVIGPGQQALVWIDLVVADYAAVPADLHHVLELDFREPHPPLVPAKLAEIVAPIKVTRARPVVIGAPLAGPGWLNGNGCCDEVSAHRGAVSGINGKLWAPERFAIDYVRVDDGKRMFKGEVAKLGSYAYFGDRIYAVADGPVVGMVQGMREEVPGGNPPGLRLDEYGGNHIVQDIGNGHYAFYAHLQPGNPLGIKVGQQLKRGQVIGLLGNTGNSGAPHLHFHIMDSPDPLGSNGLPFVFDTFVLEGQVVSTKSIEAGATTGTPFDISTTSAGPRTDAMPMHRDVMTYPTP